MGELLTMSQKELDRLEIVQKITGESLTQVTGAKRLKISYRQMKRLVAKYRKYGAAGLISKKRKNPGNRKFNDEFKQNVKSIVVKTYHDFGPTFASEKLLETHGIKINKETMRQWMIEWELRKPKKRKSVVVHQQRTPRFSLGELVQIDGSPHDWFEGRGEKCCLIVFSDDATSRISQMRFFPTETTLAYFECTKRYLKKHGRPLTFYSDRHSIFRVNTEEALGETQFERAMKELGIETICANSPQAKGRVERANRTLQDRLVKELRLNNISDIESANLFLEKFTDKYNAKFAKKPISDKNAHRSSLPANSLLDIILSERQDRIMSKNLEVSFDSRIFQIQLPKSQRGYALRKQKLQVCRLPDGHIKLWYKNRFLEYRELEARTKTAEVISSKEINHTIEKLYLNRTAKPPMDHPWKKKSFLRMVAKKSSQKNYAENGRTL
jgi:transposase